MIFENADENTNRANTKVQCFISERIYSLSQCIESYKIVGMKAPLYQFQHDYNEWAQPTFTVFECRLPEAERWEMTFSCGLSLHLLIISPLASLTTH